MVPRGLESLTVTPGSTAPDGSDMVPPIAPTPCAMAGIVEHIQNDNTTMRLTKSRALIVIPFLSTCQVGFPSSCSDDREHTPAPSTLELTQHGAPGLTR